MQVEILDLYECVKVGGYAKEVSFGGVDVARRCSCRSTCTIFILGRTAGTLYRRKSDGVRAVFSQCEVEVNMFLMMMVMSRRCR